MQTDPSSPVVSQERIAASAYFDKGRCSGHAQFNGHYCRDAAGPERWCIHCAGYMLWLALDAATEELVQSRAETEAADACTEKKVREMEIVWQRMLDENRRAEQAESARDVALARAAAAEQQLSELRAEIADVADRFDMASRRMAAKTGKPDLDANRDGLREAYFDAAKIVREALSPVPGGDGKEA